MKNINKYKLYKITALILVFIIALTAVACLQEQETTIKVLLDALEGECDIEEKNVMVGDKYGHIPQPTKEGLEFLGWYFYPDGSGEPVLDSTNVVYNVEHTLYAHWATKAINISFDLNGGEGTVIDIKVGYGRKYGWLPTGKEIKKSGYYFVGWETEDSNPIKEDSIVSIAADHILYAKWTYLNEAEKTVMLNDFNSNFSNNPSWASINSGTQPIFNPAPGIKSQTDKKKEGRNRALQAVLYNNRLQEDFRPWIKINNVAFGDYSNVDFENVRFLIFDIFLLLEDGNQLSSNLDVVLFTVRLCSGDNELGALGTYLLRPNNWVEVRVNLICANIDNISQADTIMIEFPNNPHNASQSKNSRITFYLNDLRVITK